MLSSLLTMLGVQALALISPGAAVLSILDAAKTKNRESAVLLAIGVGTGSGLLALLAFGFSNLSSTYISAVTPVITMIAALYFIYLAYKNWQGRHSKVFAKSGNTAPRKAEFFSGILIQLGNPKAILFWLALGTASFETPPSLALACFAAFLGMLNSVLFNGSFAIIFSSTQAQRVYAKYHFAVQTTLAVLFCLLAGKLLYSLVG